MQYDHDLNKLNFDLCTLLEGEVGGLSAKCLLPSCCICDYLLSCIFKGTQIITNKRKHTFFHKIIQFYMQFSAIISRYIVKTLLSSTLTNVLKKEMKIFENC